MAAVNARNIGGNIGAPSVGTNISAAADPSKVNSVFRASLIATADDRFPGQSPHYPRKGYTWGQRRPKGDEKVLGRRRGLPGYYRVVSYRTSGR